MDKNHAGRVADEARFIAMARYVVGGRGRTCTRVSSTRMGGAYLYGLRFADETRRRRDDHANQRHHHDSAYSRALWFSHCVPYGVSLFYIHWDCQLGARISSPRPSRYDNAIAE